MITKWSCWTIKKITDSKLIEELNKLPLYICPSEDAETFDKKLLQKNLLKNSEQVVGQQYPIKVAVWFEDPNKDSQTSEKRVNMRIIDGRHRYKQNANWLREYYFCSNLDEYYNLRFNLDIKKKDNPKEKKSSLKRYGDYLNQEEGIPLEKIGSTMCKRLKGMHKSQILKYLPDEWKDQTKANNRKGKTKQKNGKNIHEKCLQEIANLKAKYLQEITNLKAKNQRLWNENSKLKDYLAMLERERKKLSK